MKTIIFSISFIFCLTINSFASVTGAKNFSQEILTASFQAASQSDTEKARADIVKIVQDNIDINYISKFVLGKHWRRTTEEQRKSFAQIYERYLILTYAPKFQGYNNEKYQIDAIEEAAKGKYIAKISLIFNDNTSLGLEFFLIETTDSQYKIVDISGEGISFAATQRAEFSTLISRKGVDNFLIELENKVASLENKK